MWTQDLGDEEAAERSKLHKSYRFQLKIKMEFKNKMLKYLYTNAFGTFLLSTILDILSRVYLLNEVA